MRAPSSNAAEEIAPQAVGAGREIDAGFVNAEEMDVGLDDIQQAVGLALDEELQEVLLAMVFDIGALESFQVQLAVDLVDEGTKLKDAVFIDEVDGRRRRVKIGGVALERTIGREEFGEDRQRVKQQQEAHAKQGRRDAA